MASAVARRPQHKLLSLQHVDDSFCSGGDAPMTPLGSDVPLFAATVSPRDPAAKLAAAVSKPPQPLQASPFGSHRVLPSSSVSSDDASDDEDDDEPEDALSAKHVKANTGRWTESEHKLFLKGLEIFPYRAWKKIATLIKTRTVVQIRTHAQKYYQKLEKEEARSKEREAQDRAALAAGGPSPSTPTSPKKKLHLMRKRKCSVLELDLDLDSDSAVLPSVPKRLAREQPLAAHMSPKQKTVTAAAGNKMFFSNQLSDARFVFGRSMKNHSGMQPPHQLPLDFADAAAEAMILDFAEDKALADCSFDCADQTLASIDNDDLLQLTEEELEWFSTSSTDSTASDDLTSSAADRVDPEPFLELDTSSLGGENFASNLNLDDDDFVLDPEKFLSSYFGPGDEA